MYSHNTVQLHGTHVSVAKYNVCIHNNNTNNKNSIYKKKFKLLKTYIAINLQHTAVICDNAQFIEITIEHPSSHLMRTQELNDKIHELCIARFISIHFAQNFSE